MTTPTSRIRAEVRRLLAHPVAAARPLPVDRLARELGFAVVFQRLEGEDVSGFYLRNGPESVIGVNASHAKVRQRFTIAHELGHALLERGDGMHIDTAFRLRNTTSAMAIDPQEIAANAFAAELLMPEDEVRDAVSTGVDITDDSTVRELARRFGVSQQAVMYRLVNLGLGLDGKAAYS